MRFLIDGSPERMKTKGAHPLVAGQLLTPRTGYKNWQGTFAIDNGAFKGLDPVAFGNLLQRDLEHVNRCLFVVVPDVVGSGRRTLEMFRNRDRFKIPSAYRLAFVAQDGVEDLDIPWAEFDALFLGGKDPWKDSEAACDIVRAAKALGHHVHIGRVNQPERFRRFEELGADTCDGSGISSMIGGDRQFKNIVSDLAQPSLFEQPQVTECQNCGGHEISFGTSSDPEDVCADCGCVVITACGNG